MNNHLIAQLFAIRFCNWRNGLLKRMRKYSENMENTVKMIDFIEIYGKIKACTVLDYYENRRRKQNGKQMGLPF